MDTPSHHSLAPTPPHLGRPPEPEQKYPWSDDICWPRLPRVFADECNGPYRTAIFFLRVRGLFQHTTTCMTPITASSSYLLHPSPICHWHWLLSLTVPILTTSLHLITLYSPSSSFFFTRCHTYNLYIQPQSLTASWLLVLNIYRAFDFRVAVM